MAERDDGIEILGEGVIIAPQTVTHDPDDDSDFFAPENAVEELLARAVITLRRSQPKAAIAALVEAVNRVAADHNISGGAWL